MGTVPAGSVFEQNSFFFCFFFFVCVCVFFFFRDTWGMTLGSRKVSKRSSDPRIAYPEDIDHLRDLVLVVGIVAPFTPLRVGTRGNFVLSSPRGGMGPGDVCRVRPAAVRHRRARQSSGTGMCGDCTRVLWVPGTRGQ